MNDIYEKICEAGKYTFYFWTIPNDPIEHERPGCTVLRVVQFDRKRYVVGPERDKYCTQKLIAGDAETCIRLHDQSGNNKSLIFCAFNIYRALNHFAKGETEHSVTELDYDAEMCGRVLEYVAAHPGEYLLFEIEEAIGLRTPGKGLKTRTQEEINHYYKRYDHHAFRQFSYDMRVWLLQFYKRTADAERRQAEEKAKKQAVTDMGARPAKAPITKTIYEDKQYGMYFWEVETDPRAGSRDTHYEFVYAGQTYTLGAERDGHCTIKSVHVTAMCTCIKIFSGNGQRLSSIFSGFNIYVAFGEFAKGRSAHAVTGLDYDARMCCRVLAYAVSHPGKHQLFDIEEAIGLRAPGEGLKTRSQEEINAYYQAFDAYLSGRNKATERESAQSKALDRRVREAIRDPAKSKNPKPW
ncbi:MAG: hypothetical protein IKY83_09770 [Proteobacteria bacterium]|nr:hypothetical protein [Pseudomonadota bacterium]